MQIVCKAAENADVVLRRSEKKVLNALNKAAHHAEGARPGAAFAVREGGESTKVKQRVSEAWEKSFVLVCCLFSLTFPFQYFRPSPPSCWLSVPVPYKGLISTKSA